MKKILFLMIIFSQICYGEQKIVTVASVNGSIITNIDIINEINIIKLFSKIENNNINNQALNNLIEELIKDDELKKNKIKINYDIVEEKLNSIIKSFEKEELLLSKLLKDKIFKKLKINYEWNELIISKYANNININLKEIDTKLKNNKILTKDEKNKLIDLEKNNKLNIYSIIYFEKLKQNALIKIY